VDIQRLGTVPYEQAWSLQRTLAEDRAQDRRGDTLLLLEHPSVYTAGRRTRPEERPFDGTPVVDVDRGGKITWHGPGQLVGYPIMRLPQPFDVVAYVRALEAELMTVCADFGLETRRVDGRSGVWTSDGQRKVAAIGVRVARGVTMHGFALNCDPDLSAFGAIVPCGITDAGVTSLTQELGNHVSVADALVVVEQRVPAVLADLARGIAPPTGSADQRRTDSRTDSLTGAAR
jgi:lipoyl(octanoyl) transferase